MTTEQTDQNADELVTYKVRNRVAKKVMQDIHRQVDDIGQQVQMENKAKNFLLPLLVLLFVMMLSLFTFWPDLMRLLSGFFN